MLNPIPTLAERIAQAIREQVPKPRDLPRHDSDGLRWCKNEADAYCPAYCPMGLLPTATVEQPYSPTHFSDHKFTLAEIDSFYSWWDDFTDEEAEAAVDMLWSPQS